MINARELRIGNLVVVNGLHEGQLREVEQIGACGTMRDENRVIMFKDCEVGEFAENLEPIPLTESWLERMPEFEGHSGQTFQYTLGNTDGDYPSYIWIDIAYNKCFVEIVRSGTGAWQPKVQYLHQLQNLIYSLTNTELTLTP